MTKKIVFGAALALVIVGLAAPSASAACNPPKSVGTYNVATQASAYWHTTLSGGSLVGKIWSGAVDFTGTCNNPPGPGILYFGANPGDVGVSLSLGDACVPGCPTGSLSIQATALTATGSETIISKVAETSTGAVNFDFSGDGSHPMAAYPRPRVTGSSRVSTNVSLNLAVDAVPAFGGAGSDIVGYNILSASGASDPGRLASAYSLRTTIPSPGGAGGTGTTPVDCSNINNDQWVVTQLVFTGGASNTVSAATRVKCNPALANPKFNVVPKKGLPTSTQH
jgi:hypothetical protein